jgi:hypothetical protein
MATSGTYTLSGAATLATDISGLAPGTTYSIQVRSYNGTTYSPGNGDIIVATTLSAGLQPTDPTDVQVRTGTPSTATTVTITWQPADQNGGAGLSGYQITWDPPYGGTQPQIFEPGASLPYAATITDLEPYSRYTFTVTTINEDASASPGYAKVVAATARSDGWHDPSQFAIDNTVAATSNSIALDWVDPDREDSSTSDLSAFLITWQPPDGGGSVYTDKYDTYKIVTGLEPETTYSFNIVSVDESGNTSPGNYYITGSTIALVGLLAPLDLAQDGQATNNTVSMTWIPAVATAPDTIESNVITAYDISADYYLPPQTSVGDQSNYTYSNLSAGTEYRFSLVAFSTGFSAECATTFDATTSVSGAPSDPILSLTSIAYNNAAFSWNLSGNGRNGGVNLSSYFIEYYDTNAGPETALTKNPAGSLANRSTVIFGLTANTDYTFKVYARNVSGLISPGGTEATVEATTLELGAPFTPSNLQAHPYIPATSTSVTVMFNSAYKGPAENSEVTNHIVQISPPTSTDQGTFNIGLDTTLTISNLTEDTLYNVRVRAENADFILSPWSGSLGLTTSPAAGPGDVGGLRTSGLVDADSIPIAWTSPDEQGGDPITAYEVSYTS